MDFSKLEQLLSPFLLLNEPPKSNPFYSVYDRGLIELARRLGVSVKIAMLSCLEHDIWPERYRAQRGAVTSGDQARIIDSTVAVIGSGGLGGHVVMMLARAGVGSITICDGDVFDESNLNRQQISDMNRIGRNKAVCAAEAVAGVNPHVEVSIRPVWAEESNISEILDGASVVVDCLDNHPSRYMVEDAARHKNIPFVHGSLAGREGFVLTVFPDSPGLKNLYGPNPVDKSDAAETILGVPTITPGMIAGLQVNEVFDILTGAAIPDGGKLIHLDLSVPEIEIIRIS